MGILDETRFVERLRFFDGQRLLASDLQGIEAFHSEMRWLHNRSFHQPGIGNGYAVTGERDAREIRIGPGYALDALGREIVLTHEQVEPIPPVAAETDGQSVFFDLVVSYDEEPEAAETRQGICLDRGVIRLREEPVLCFVRLQRDPNGNLQAVDPKLRQEIFDGLRIILARLEVIDCRLRQTISVAQRRSARPARQPYLACGEEILTATFDKPDYQRPNRLLLRAVVDTSAAGFQSPPCYSVRLDRPRIYPDPIITEKIVFYILDSSPLILDPGKKSFKVEMFFEVVTLGGGTPRNPDLSNPEFGWKAVWMGVE
jgi:hypothetical protein